MKRAAALFLTIALILSFFTFRNVYAATFSIDDVPRAAGDPSGTCGDSLKWLISTKTDTLYIYGSGTMYDYYYDVDDAPPWNTAISVDKKATHVYIAEGVKSIGEKAFYYLDEITDVTIPSGLTKIGLCAFYKCTSIKKLMLPKSVTSIGTYAFYGMTGLTDIRLPHMSYPDHMLEGCTKLKTMYFDPVMSSSVVGIGQKSFDGCTSLETIYFPGSRTEWEGIIVPKANATDCEELLEAETVCDYKNYFLDVPYTANYLKSVNWAYEHGVIMGTSDDTFGPNDDCKRCDLAVMLYRMYGKPSISGMSIPFTDVKSGAYYYKAVVWAYNKGYIKGTSATSFNPNGSITRQDMVVILWRIDGSKKVNIANPFTDVDESSYAYKAIMWAYKNSITSGTSATTFSPTNKCKRYQLAVFLNKFNKIVHVI